MKMRHENVNLDLREVSNTAFWTFQVTLVKNRGFFFSCDQTETSYSNSYLKIS